MAREQYVRPPLVAKEPPSPLVAVWRFRVVAGLIAIAAVLVISWLFLSLSGITNEDPGLGSLNYPAGP